MSHRYDLLACAAAGHMTPLGETSPGEESPEAEAEMPLFLGEGEFAERIYNTDWSNTPIGPLSNWPASLRTAVGTMLAFPLPIAVLWGKDGVQIYNREYQRVSGITHPGALGQRFSDWWGPALPTARDLTEAALRGEGRSLENQQLFVVRSDCFEETFLNCWFSPILDEHGNVGGALHVLHDTTAAVLRERRARVIRDVADRTANCKTLEEAGKLLVEALQSHAPDVPFALLYSVSQDGAEARLIAASGLNPGSVAAPERIDLNGERSRSWPLSRTVGGQAVEITELERRFGIFRSGPYPEAPRAAFMISLGRSERPLAHLVIGVSARNLLDDAAREFYALLAATVSASIARATQQENRFPSVSSSVSLRRPGILIAEGDPSTREQVRTLLARHWNVQTAADTASALAALRASRPDLLLVSSQFLEPVGDALTKELQTGGSLSDLPMIWLTDPACEIADEPLFSTHDQLPKPVAERDLYARVRVQLELSELRAECSEHRARLCNFLMRVPMPVAVTFGSDHRYQLVNDAWQALFPHKKLCGQTMRNVHPELIGTGLLEKRDQVFRTGKRFAGVELPVPLPVASGALENRYFTCIHEPLHSVDGEVESIATFAFDNTELVMTRQELDDSDKRKDEFLAMLAHELRNPLAPIRTALHILKYREPAGLSRHLQIIDRQTENLTRLVDDLLDVSRITRGMVELRRENVDFTSVISRALDSLRDLFDRRKLNVSLTLPVQTAFVLGDPLRLEQVVVNLLTNSAKYTDPGGKIHVTLERHDLLLEFHVRDTGVGIAPAMLPRIFNLFEQAQQSLDRSQGGLGIGLTIVRSLVELHGGDVTARSAGSGLGSEFIVRLPLSEEERSSQGAAKVKARAPKPSETKLRVLVVDDNIDAAETIQDLLLETGHHVSICHTGPAALELTRTFDPHVVLLDIGLPQMDGYEVARTLRRTLSEPPVLVALTGYGQESDRRNSMEAGFAEHLVKPVRLETLVAVLERCAIDHSSMV